jgi:tetratricopeptide (TPR) repeat protein
MDMFGTNAERFAIALLLCGALFARGAAADPPSADQLFREGRELLLKGEYDAACDKLAASQRLDPSSGTLINLALCHESQGKTATAWNEYRAAERLARAQGREERMAEAHRRALALEPKLRYVTVRVGAWVAGLDVRRDGEALESASLGAPVPIDPGEHVISASAPGYKPWSTKIDAPEGTTVVDIPPLEREAPAPVVLAPAVTPAPPLALSPLPRPMPRETNRASAWWVIGGGSAAVVVGSIFGVLASNDYASAETMCPGHAGCSSDTLARYDRAQSRAWIADVSVGVGVVAIGAATAWLLFHRDAPPANAAMR